MAAVKFKALLCGWFLVAPPDKVYFFLNQFFFGWNNAKESWYANFFLFFDIFFKKIVWLFQKLAHIPAVFCRYTWNNKTAPMGPLPCAFSTHTKTKHFSPPSRDNRTLKRLSKAILCNAVFWYRSIRKGYFISSKIGFLLLIYSANHIKFLNLIWFPHGLNSPYLLHVPWFLSQLIIVQSDLGRVVTSDWSKHQVWVRIKSVSNFFL